MSLFLSMNAFAFSIILYIITNNVKNYKVDNGDRVILTLMFILNLVVSWIFYSDFAKVVDVVR